MIHKFKKFSQFACISIKFFKFIFACPSQINLSKILGTLQKRDQQKFSGVKLKEIIAFSIYGKDEIKKGWKG